MMVKKKQRVGVFVYGDIGRSPRMQNHAEELSNYYDVYLMGYIDSSPREAILENQNIHLVDLEINGLGTIRAKSFYLYALVRIILQICQIIYLLGWKYRGLKFVLVQNPPSIPNLFAIWLTSFIGKYKIYIDFHNYGYTILGLKVKNFIIFFAKKYEHFFGRKCQRAFCVSDAMKEDLQKNWNINAVTLYDRPRKQFVNASISKRQFFEKYGFEEPKSDQLLIVSSTSWTKDEDFSILLSAINDYDSSKASMKIRTFITGKGPQKQFYLRKISQLQENWKKVSINTVWLDADDYPFLLSLCDLGVCLHYSSSGVDLPMKVVDMFGAGIPVLAIRYKALTQLVKDGYNGYIFSNGKQLLQQLITLSESKEELKKLKKGAQKEKEYTWDKEWEQKFMENK